MAKAIRQFRWYNDADRNRNYPSSLTAAQLASGSIFFRDASLGAITQLGIQALPGSKFFVNNSAEPIIIGSTGIYELDLEGLAEITALAIDFNSLQVISATNNAYLIVDAIYNTEG